MTAIDPSLFKAYDVRATVDLLTPEAARLIGRAIGSEARDRGLARIVVARDGRLSSPALAEALIEGLLASGIDLFDLGLAPTPLLYFAARRHADGCGVMITGSHNPPQYNGIKILLGGDTIDGAALQALRERIENDDFCTGSARVQALDVTDEYLQAVCGQVGLAKPLRIVIDCGNGVPGLLAPALYQRLGCELEALYCEVDGHFPNHHPDPQIPANLADLQQAVLAHQADVGLAFDGDGDRLGVVSSSGQIIPGDQLLMLFAKAELADRPGLVLYDVKSSRLVTNWVEALGGMTRAIPTGHSHMKRELAHSGALLAGELSGHFAFAEWGVDDALYAGAKLLAMVASGLDIDAEIAAMPRSIISPELQLVVPDDAHELVERIAATAIFPSASRIFTVDGLRIEYPDGFGLIRASNTTPVLTLRIEADNRDAQLRIKNELAAALAPLTFPELE